eukprot:GILK01006211.1.p1 GENE.GILK01006211.1~~GILK01006211.1.p1  ORF type:complete len:183 (+),score=15.48 GILK01006211.1:46-549(+)
MATPESFSVFVSKDDFKFNAAHFIAYKGYREKIHGHNYRVSVRLDGNQVGADGYLMEFGDIKKVTRSLCRELNERVIIPMQSDCLVIEQTDKVLRLTCEDGAEFSFPLSDCVLLPIVHSSAEELARYFYHRLIETFTVDSLRARQVVCMEVSVAEAPTQEAKFRKPI